MIKTLKGMKYNLFALMGALALSTTMIVQAQDYDDVYYNANTDDNGSTQQVVTRQRVNQPVIINDVQPGSTYRVTVDRVNTMDVDTYNRRGPAYDETYDYDNKVDYDSIYENEGEFANTKRIQRFYKPDVVISSNDEELVTLYYDSRPEITLIIGSNFGTGLRWGWGGGIYTTWYDPWYDPWYPGYYWRPYGYWGWGYRPWYYSSWRWDPWWGGPRPYHYYGYYRPGYYGGHYRYDSRVWNGGGRRPNLGSGGNYGRGGSRPSIGGRGSGSYSGGNGSYSGGRRPSMGGGGYNTGNVNRATGGTRPSGGYSGGGTARRPSMGGSSSSGTRSYTPSPSSGRSYGGYSGGRSSGGYSGGRSSGGYSGGYSGGRSSGGFGGGGGFSGGRGGGGHSGGFGGGGGGRRR